MKIKNKQLKSYPFIFIVIIFTFFIYSNHEMEYDYSVLVTNFIIIILSLIFMVLGDNYNFSLNKVLMLFFFFFFGIAPIIQYQRGIVLWSYDLYYSSYDYYRMNVIIILIMILYQFLYRIFSKFKSSNIEKTILSNNEISFRFISHKKILLLSFFSTFLIIIIFDFSLFNMILRDGNNILNNSTQILIFNYFIRPIPLICLIYYKINKKMVSSKISKNELILWAFALLTNFPTGAPRFYIAALYIPLLILYIYRIKKRYLSLNKILIFGLLFVFPFLDQARSVNSLSELKFGFDFKMFTQGHFDSYQMFMQVVNENIITYGNQLLTSFFFFVPRTIWTNKSVGSGMLIANQSNFYFNNVSMNFFGEGYINFGYLGIILFLIIISYLNARLDLIYWSDSENSANNILYLLSLGLLFFVLRGDLLSGFAFTFGLFISAILVFRIIRV